MNIKWDYVTKTTADKITNAEKKYGAVLPEDVIQCVLQNNGGYPDKSCFDTNESKDCVFEKLLSFNEADADNVYIAADFFKENDIDLFPIGADPFGNYICISSDGMVLYRHETGKMEYICKTFSELLQKLKK